jgi:hypothetical protein
MESPGVDTRYSFFVLQRVVFSSLGEWKLYPPGQTFCYLMRKIWIFHFQVIKSKHFFLPSERHGNVKTQKMRA